MNLKASLEALFENAKKENDYAAAASLARVLKEFEEKPQPKAPVDLETKDMIDDIIEALTPSEMAEVRAAFAVIRKHQDAARERVLARGRTVRWKTVPELSKDPAPAPQPVAPKTVVCIPEPVSEVVAPVEEIEVAEEAVLLEPQDPPEEPPSEFPLSDDRERDCWSRARVRQ